VNRADPVDLAHEVAYAGEVSPQALSWLRDGLRRYLRGDASLEVALRLSNSSRCQARNLALIDAARTLDAGRGLSAWVLAGLLAQAIRRAEHALPARARLGSDASMSALDDALARAARSGARPMRSRERLYDLLNEALTNAEGIVSDRPAG
jgi:hypothetical protein